MVNSQVGDPATTFVGCCAPSHHNWLKAGDGRSILQHHLCWDAILSPQLPLSRARIISLGSATTNPGWALTSEKQQGTPVPKGAPCSTWVNCREEVPSGFPPFPGLLLLHLHIEFNIFFGDFEVAQLVSNLICLIQALNITIHDTSDADNGKTDLCDSFLLQPVGERS